MLMFVAPIILKQDTLVKVLAEMIPYILLFQSYDLSFFGEKI